MLAVTFAWFAGSATDSGIRVDSSCRKVDGPGLS